MYRTRELGQWSANAPRLAQRLVRDGQLVQLAHGLFAAPKRSRFGDVPPTDEALLRAFLGGEPFVFTGPERWNALGLGTTAVFATPLVYNTKVRAASPSVAGSSCYVEWPFQRHPRPSGSSWISSRMPSKQPPRGRS